MPLNSHLIKLIEKNGGSINIAEFMAEALMNHEHGYYQKTSPFGKAGDFVTSPEISQVFGELIGIWCAHSWQQMGMPSDFNLVELGPGRGTLMHDLLRGTKNISGLHAAMNIFMFEGSSKLQQIQKNCLSSYARKITWINKIEHLPTDKPCIIIANEFFDALPIHQYVKQNGKWCERVISFASDKYLKFLLTQKEAINRVIDLKHPNADDGSFVETCPAAITIFKELSKLIHSKGGAGLIIDYGYDKYGYENTLQAVKNHSYHPVLENPGEADITAHVDFVALQEAACDCKITPYLTTQRDFLLSMGIETRKNTLLNNADNSQKNDIISSIDRLINPKEMGSLFKVLAVMNHKLPKPAGF